MICPRSRDFQEWDQSGQSEDRCHSQASHTQICVRSFLGHARFYRRFIKDFSKTARPLTNILAKDVPFIFNDGCLTTWEKLKIELISAPIISLPDWSKPFEIMCGAFDFIIGAVLG